MFRLVLGLTPSPDIQLIWDLFFPSKSDLKMLEKSSSAGSIILFLRTRLAFSSMFMVRKEERREDTFSTFSSQTTPLSRLIVFPKRGSYSELKEERKMSDMIQEAPAPEYPIEKWPTFPNLLKSYSPYPFPHFRFEYHFFFFFFYQIQLYLFTRVRIQSDLPKIPISLQNSLEFSLGP